MTTPEPPTPAEGWHITHPILGQLLALGVGIQLTEQGWKVEGFYKSGSVTLIPVYRVETPERTIVGFTAVSRYQEAWSVATWDDLVQLHFTWWRRSQPRWKGWHAPESPAWAQEYTRLGLHAMTATVDYIWKEP